MKVNFRPIEGDSDIERACSLLRDSMLGKEFDRTIFSCSGYAQYLRAASCSSVHSATWLIGAYDGDLMIGFAEWRRLDQQLVLNNLNVDTAYRGHGIGGRLVALGEVLALKEGIRSLKLDVFAWNEHAHAWYLRLGFVESDRTYWYEGDQDPLEDSRDKEKTAPYLIEDNPMAEAHHTAYGFSSLQIRLLRGTVQIGRLGSTYFRIRALNADWDWNGSLTAALSHLDPGRKLLVLSPEPGLSERDSRLIKISESVRMHKKLEDRAVYYG